MTSTSSRRRVSRTRTASRWRSTSSNEATRVTVPLLIDIVRACTARAEPKGDRGKKRGKATDEDADDSPEFEPWSRELKLTGGTDHLNKRMHAANPPGSVPSWRALQGRLSRLNRLRVFFDETRDGTRPLNCAELIRPGRVSVVDLSDTGFSELNNLAIADVLRGIQDAQDESCEKFEQQKGPPPTPVLIVVEEAHEFLSEERIDKTPVLFEQVAKVCKRGRKGGRFRSWPTCRSSSGCATASSCMRTPRVIFAVERTVADGGAFKWLMNPRRARRSWNFHSRGRYW